MVVPMLNEYIRREQVISIFDNKWFGLEHLQAMVFDYAQHSIVTVHIEILRQQD